MHLTAIVLAAGRGLRFSRPNGFTIGGGIPPSVRRWAGNAEVSKPLFEIGYRPILIYSLLSFSKHPAVRDIILVVNPSNKVKIIAAVKKYRINKIKKVVLGGRRRQDSVINGLKVINQDTDFILIHDSARPFISHNIISSVIKAAKTSGAAIVGVPAKATIKEVHSFRRRRTSPCRRQVGLRPIRLAKFKVQRTVVVKRTLKRSKLWEIQTPQVFKKELILKAYRRFGKLNVTDDASLVEKLGYKVSLVTGSYSNIKITTPEDIIIAKAILENRVK